MSKRKSTSLSVQSNEQLLNRAWQALDRSRRALADFKRLQDGFDEQKAEFARRHADELDVRHFFPSVY